MPVVEGTFVMVKNDNKELATVLSEAMQKACMDCYAEGTVAPNLINERMMKAYMEATAAWDEAHKPPVEP